jgi:hypothetical protein
MSDSLTLMLKPADWEKYKTAAMEKAGLSEDQVIWGRGPASYPCLVAGFITNAEKSPGAMFVCCYVYVEQALELVNAAGIPHNDAAPSVVNVVGPEQAQFNETMLAHMAAILHVLTDTGITSEEHYTPIFTRELQSLEQKHADDLVGAVQALKSSLKKDPQEEP